VTTGHSVYPGLDLARLAEFLDTRRPDLFSGQIQADRITGGRSNLTYLVTDAAGTQLVLRRPPVTHVLATAHDMSRECTVLGALHGATIAVPAVIEFCADESVLGAPFYLMEYVPGVAFKRAEQLAALGPARTELICERMVDTLVALHSIVPTDVGLAEFGRPIGFLERQVRRWKKQLDASRSRALPGIEQFYAGLASAIPSSSNVSILHGDYRLDNLLFDEQDTVTAVLDWEMATLGEPLTDLALLVAYRKLTAELNVGPDSNNVANAPGFLAAEQLVERYFAQSGRNAPSMGFHLGLAYFKLITIIEGIHYRNVQSQAAGTETEDVSKRIQPLIAAGLTALKEEK
jgi:aminoglycoside phosphotransferase (APT) family kinase protein